MSAKRKHQECAACGDATALVFKTTFMVDRRNCRGEFRICESCWGLGSNNEAWNEKITQRIIARHARLP